jgi:hypothetical protein
VKECPEINCPNAFEKYNGKEVWFRTLIDEKSTPIVGRFFVSPISKWMSVRWIVEADEKHFVEEDIPVEQATLANILPVSPVTVDSVGRQIAFVIHGHLPRPLPVSHTDSHQIA